MHQYYVSRLVVLDREEGLVDNRKRAELYYSQQRRDQAGQGGILTPDVRSTQAKAAPVYHCTGCFNKDLPSVGFGLADKPLV